LVRRWLAQIDELFLGVPDAARRYCAENRSPIRRRVRVAFHPLLEMLMTPARLKRENITFRRIPYEIRLT